MKKYFWHNVFRVAFESEHDSPEFCSGQSMGMYLDKMPLLPPDETGMTDDTYLSNYAALNGNVVKPPESKVYFNVAESLREWMRQQIRIHLGVLKSMNFFPSNKKQIERFINWPYSHIRICRIKPSHMSIRRRFFYFFYIYFSNRVAFEAEKKYKNMIFKDWGTACSSKSY